MRSIVNIAVVTAAAAMLLSCSGPREYDVCVYGGTAAAVTAAYSAAQMGMDVVVVSPDMQIGGMTSGGLGFTDIGNKQVVTGIARQFYRKVGRHYGRLEQWTFEPHVAEEILEEYLSHRRITVLRRYKLLSVEKSGTDIRSIEVFSDDTLSLRARTFIDCTYEGDLMARAGVSYVVGREDNSVYGEDYNGVQMMDGHQFPDGIDPYVVPGDPSSGLLWGISRQVLAETGSGDGLTQAYNYRICLTDSLANMIPITEPDNYDPSRYELLIRLFEAMPDKRGINDYFIWSLMPGRKTDVNNRSGFSTDMIGMNYDYPEGTYEQRDSIARALTDYTKGLLYFYVSDPRVPRELSSFVSRWGYARDEYVSNGNWTPQVYVREARRMVGEYVATQADCQGRVTVDDAVAYAAYTMDSHNCQRIVVEKDGRHMVKNEGNVEIKGGLPYPVSYRSITPRRDECTNLLVPVCLSASHIAFGSIRMEPVFMVLGQSSGIAASVAVRRNAPVQDVPVSEIRRVYDEDPCMDGSAPDVVIDDDSDAVRATGRWTRRRGNSGYGPTYMAVSGADPTRDTLAYTLPAGLRGKYDLYCYSQMKGNVNPVTEYRLDGEILAVIDIRDSEVIGQTSGEWMHLGALDMRRHGGSVITAFPQADNRQARADALLLVKR